MWGAFQSPLASRIGFAVRLFLIDDHSIFGQSNIGADVVAHEREDTHPKRQITKLYCLLGGTEGTKRGRMASALRSIQ
jgi:hypothetical protein